MSTYPDMLYHMGGAPVMSSGLIPFSTGDYFFVDSSTGLSSNLGTTVGKPMATIDQAINKCTADKGDVIIVLPNHAENITLGSLVPDVAGITIVGLGNASNQPELTFTATTSIITVTGANTVLRNLRFLAGISAVVIGIEVSVDNVTIEGCTFNYGGTTDYDFLIGIDIDAFDYCTVRNCTFQFESTTGSNSGVQLDDAHFCVVDNCTFTGDFAVGAVANPTADALCTNMLITNNLIHNNDTGAAASTIFFENACTGLIANNTIGTRGGLDADASIDPGSCNCINNWISCAADESAIQTPTTNSS